MQPIKESIDQSVRLLQAIAIGLVVLGHIASPVGSVIFSFHMPLFFFLGGLFLNPNLEVLSSLQSSAKRLFVPYFLFGFIGLAATTIKHLLLHRATIDPGDSLIGLLYWMDMPHLQHYGFLLWFLPALFCGRFVAFLIFKYITNLWLAMGLAVTIFAVPTFLNFPLPFGLDKGMLGVFWIAVGYVFYRHCDASRILWGLVCACVILISISAAGVQRLDIATMQIGNPWISLPYTCAIAVIMFQLSQFLVGRFRLLRSGAVSYLGANTMLIFVAHPYTNNAAHLLVGNVAKVGWVLEFAITVALLILLLRIKATHPNHRLFNHV